MVNIFTLMTGMAGPSGFGSGSTAEDVTFGIDASNLTAIITGGASGIGFETARVLALRNAHVIIAARNMDAAKDAKQLILKDNSSARIDIFKLDLCSNESVREFAHDFLSRNLPLNILINNAGIMFCPHQLSKDGIETQFATNHIGHFLLTNLLLEKMKQTAKDTGIEGRIVNLSSIAHIHTYSGGIRFHKINEKSGYSDKMAYGQSKLANILHATELSRRLKEEGANVTANAVHPGIIMTNLMKHSYFLMKLLQIFTGPLIWKNVPQVSKIVELHLRNTRQYLNSRNLMIFGVLPPSAPCLQTLSSLPPNTQLYALILSVLCLQINTQLSALSAYCLQTLSSLP